MRGLSKIIGYAGLILAGCTAAVSAYAAENFVYGSYVPRSHTFHEKSLLPYFETLEEQSNGELRFRLLSDGTMVEASNTLTGIRNGTVDMGLVVDVYIPSTLPTEATLNELALFANDVMSGSAAMTEMVLRHCPQCLEEWKRAGAVPIAFYSTPLYYLMCNTEVSGLDSIRGKRIKTATAWNGLAAHFGATPVSLATSETYEALSRGQIDCAFGGAAYLTNYGLADVVDYIVDMPMGAVMGVNFLNMNIDRWQSLTDAQRALFIDNAAEAIVNVAQGYQADDDEAMQTARSDGTRFTDPGEPMKNSYDEYLTKERERVIALAKKRGVNNPEALVDGYLELLDEWEAIVAEADGDREALMTALNERIFSKVDL